MLLKNKWILTIRQVGITNDTAKTHVCIKEENAVKGPQTILYAYKHMVPLESYIGPAKWSLFDMMHPGIFLMQYLLICENKVFFFMSWSKILLTRSKKIFPKQRVLACADI